MLDQKIEIFSKKTKSKFLPNYDLKKLNWFNIGGKAKFFFKADTLQELVEFLKEFGNNQENVENIQKAFNHRAKMNGLSTKGEWSENLEKESAA